MTDPTEKLLPCPFCGGEGVPMFFQDGTGFVICDRCDANLVREDRPHTTHSEAVAAWNRRDEEPKWTMETPKNGLYWVVCLESQGSLSAYPAKKLKLVRIRGCVREILFYDEYNGYSKDFKQFMDEQKDYFKHTPLWKKIIAPALPEKGAPHDEVDKRKRTVERIKQSCVWAFFKGESNDE